MKNVFKSKISTLFVVTAVVAVIVFSLGGCMSMLAGLAKSQYKDYGVFDKSVPEDQMCDLRFSGIRIKLINGVYAGFSQGKDGSQSISGHIKIPAGVNTIVFDWVEVLTEYEGSVNYGGNYTTTTYTTTTKSLKDITFSDVEMLAGHNYNIGGVKENNGNLKFWLLDQTSMPSGFHGDKVPKPPKKSKNLTEFEGKWKNRYGETFEFSGNTWLQKLSPYTGLNMEPYYFQMRGTFEFDDGILTLFLDETSRNGSVWLNMKPFENVFIYKYSLNGNKLMLELPWMLPETEYISSTPKVSFSGFEGVWEMPNTQIMYFHNNVVIYMDNHAQKIINTGIFTYTDNQFLLWWRPGAYFAHSYTVVPEGLQVTSKNAAQTGIWKRRNDISTSMYDSKNPLVGYWESKTKDKITILNISAYGWGVMFECNPQFELISKEMIEYDDKTPSQFTGRVEIDSHNSFTIEYEYKFEGANLLVSSGEVQYRFIKK